MCMQRVFHHKVRYIFETEKYYHFSVSISLKHSEDALNVNGNKTLLAGSIMRWRAQLFLLNANRDFKRLFRAPGNSSTTQ